jgi:hypothetical protein
MPPLKHLNHRSEFLFTVNDSKQFKVKRNPNFKKVSKEPTMSPTNGQ